MFFNSYGEAGADTRTGVWENIFLKNLTWVDFRKSLGVK